MARQKKRGKQSRGKTTPGQLRPQPAPGRASDQPFCSYMSEQGVTCSETAGLTEVFVIEGEGSPRLTWLACPLHEEEVRQVAATFVLQSQQTPRQVVFRYHEQTYALWVSSSKIVD